MDDIKKIIKEQGCELFEKRGSLLSLWQEISDNFYPERADFTTVRNLGDEFGRNLMTSYPVLARRDLGNAISSILRPTNKKWLHVRTVENWDKLGIEAKRWLEWAEGRMLRAMNHRTSQFVRATKEGDHDFATFGQTVIQVTLNSSANGLLYRCWHLRDVAWCEDADGQTSTVYRKWKPTLKQLSGLFGRDRLSNKHQQALQDGKHQQEANIWHVVAPLDYLSAGSTSRLPFRSIYFDVDNNHIIEDIGLHEQEYVIPRWQTVSGSQYAYSPASIVALPDARLIQAMTAVLLEAGEKAVTPPMLAVQEAIRSDINLFAGGITYADDQYDERLGEVLRPITMDKSGIPLGLEMSQDTRMMITEAFYLNKLTLPAPGTDMTAYEVGQRIQEYIRQAMPLFEPMETEYNAPICDRTFSVMMRAGAFGSPFDMPDELRNAEVMFSFESPLYDAVDREKGQRFLEASQMLSQAVALDPMAGHTVDAVKALRDVLSAVGVPAAWIRSESQVADMVAQDQAKVDAAQTLQTMQQGADVMATIANAAPTVPQGEIVNVPA